MKGYAFKVETQGPGDITDLTARVYARGLSDRFFAAGGQLVRLEDRIIEGDLLFLEFAGPRSGHGPGRMARGRPMAEIALAHDEQFGEDTAMVVHIPTGYAAMQYNHYGPRARAVEEYLNTADRTVGDQGNPTAYHLGACLRPDAYGRLQAMGFIQEVEFTIFVPGVMPGGAQAGLSVGNALDAPLPQGVEVVSMKMRGRAGGALGRQDALTLIDDLFQKGGDLIAAKVWGKPAEGAGRKRPVDLMKEHLSDERDIRPGRGQRFARPERWMALREMLANWQATGRLARP